MKHISVEQKNENPLTTNGIVMTKIEEGAPVDEIVTIKFKPKHLISHNYVFVLFLRKQFVVDVIQVPFLKKRNFDINLPQPKGEGPKRSSNKTPVQYAVICRQTDILELLLNYEYNSERGALGIVVRRNGLCPKSPKIPMRRLSKGQVINFTKIIQIKK